MRAFAKLQGAAVVSAGLTACAGEGGRDSGSFTSELSLSSASASATSGDDGLDTGFDDDDFDLGNADDSPNNECDEIVDTAAVGPRSQDIIFVVDTSGSMVQEAGFVQNQMNSFSIQIDAANVDARIILLAEYPPVFGPGVCIDPPLGSGGCPSMDSNPPEFLHVPDSDIGSSDALIELIAHYPNYSPFLRPTSVTHVVVVSDDNSALPADMFTDMFTSLSPHLVDFVFHGIVSSEDPDAACNAGTACCNLAAAQGTVYQELIVQTGGVEGNLCEQQFQPVFAAVAQEVIGGATLACSYAIPPPPEGETFDKDQVNVEFTDAAGGTLEVGRVDGVADCAAVDHGWYYDDPSDPSVIEVCPQTCETIRGFDESSVSIKFGCATIPAG
jgi:hypothetical protein